MPQTLPWAPAGIVFHFVHEDPENIQETNLYVIQEGDDGPIKIGVARHPEERLLTLQQANVRPLRIVCHIPLTQQCERAIHAALEEDRVAGEWFAPTPDVLAAVAEIQNLAHFCEDMARDDYTVTAYDIIESGRDYWNDRTRARVAHLID